MGELTILTSESAISFVKVPPFIVRTPPFRVMILFPYPCVAFPMLSNRPDSMVIPSVSFA